MASCTLGAQTYVTPMMGGGQVPAEMCHIDIYYDAASNQLQARVDDTYGTPRLRPLEAGYAFDPDQPCALLNGKAYNAQYGWNVGGFFAMPPGAAIWIELVDRSPGLETYGGWGRFGSYAPIFGTAGSPGLWRWSGIMVHNTYAVRNPSTDMLFAEYHIFFGDSDTGARDSFMHLDDTTVRLEWTTDPVEAPLRFDFGASGPTNAAPLSFVNADQFVTESQFVLNLHQTNTGSGPAEYTCRIPTFVSQPGEANSVVEGCRLAMQLVSLSGPPRARLTVWAGNAAEHGMTMPVGESLGTHCVSLSPDKSSPDTASQEIGFAVNQAGLYCLAFRLVDAADEGPLHAPSPTYSIHLQAGVTIAWLQRRDSEVEARFGGAAGRTFYLERSSALGAPARWEKVAGPLAGTPHLQHLTDRSGAQSQNFYRLRSE